MKILSYILLLLGIVLFSNSSFGQNSNLGFEYNFYPAGNILGIQYEFTPNSNHHAFNARIAANITRRKNFSGLNDDERGWGPGIGVGYRYYIDPECQGLYFGGRLDAWGMTINWKDSLDLKKTGITKIMVLQPTFELGYFFKINQYWHLGTAFTNGVEINVMTDGDEVGQGWITLWQFRIARDLIFQKK